MDVLRRLSPNHGKHCGTRRAYTAFSHMSNFASSQLKTPRARNFHIATRYETLPDLSCDNMLHTLEGLIDVEPLRSAYTLSHV